MNRFKIKLEAQKDLIVKIVTAFQNAIEIYNKIAKNPTQTKIANKKIKILQKRLKSKLVREFSARDTLQKDLCHYQIQLLTAKEYRP